MRNDFDKKNDGLPISAMRTVDRRQWIDWVGKTVVLSLAGGKVLGGCGFSDDPMEDEIGSDSGTDGASTQYLDSGISDEMSTDNADLCLPSTGRFTYSPRDLAETLGDRWPIRTVDSQNLEWILDNWQLTVDGMVAHPLTLDFTELTHLPRTDQVVDFHCVEGWSVYDVPWNGIHLGEIVKRVMPHNDATYVTFHTIDGVYNESLPLQVALEPRTILAYGVDCNTLPLAHGFPLRLVVPRLLAYKSAKYVTRIEFTDAPIAGYWVAVGYPYDGEVPSSRLRPGKY